MVETDTLTLYACIPLWQGGGSGRIFMFSMEGATAWFHLCMWHMSRGSGAQARALPTLFHLPPWLASTEGHSEAFQQTLHHPTEMQLSRLSSLCSSAAGRYNTLCLGETQVSDDLSCSKESYQILSPWLELIPSANMHTNIKLNRNCTYRQKQQQKQMTKALL